jgi:hypothetical protein
MTLVTEKRCKVKCWQLEKKMIVMTVEKAGKLIKPNTLLFVLIFHFSQLIAGVAGSVMAPAGLTK